MTPAGKKLTTGAAAVAVLVGIIVIWHLSHKPVNPLVNGGEQNVANFDQFQQDLATRVLEKLGDGTTGSDFSVIVATAAYPLGTLLRPTGSVPADLEDCVPAPPPTPLSAQRLFPSYTMSSDTAVAANIGSRALDGLNSAGVNLSHSSKVQYTIADTQIQIMDDKSVERVTGQGNCGKYIAAHPGMRLVRGAVIGKMTFIVQVDNPASVKAQLTKIGGLNVNDNPQASTVSIADDQIEPIVELLSEFGTGKSASTSPTTPKRVQAAASPASAVANLDQFQQVTDTELRFPSTQTTLDAKTKEALGQVATQLEGRKGSIVEVQGYSHPGGQAGIQQSQDMADAVVRYLVVDHHVPVFKIYRVAMGKAPREEPTGSGNGGTVVHVTLMANSLEALPPQAPQGGVHMYVQEDAADTPEDGAKVVQLLRTGWPTANVESAVQRIPSQKMPDVAQVRYFSAADEALADRCIAILRRAYPGARAVRVGLPSPSGQLEVWLPRKH